MQSTESITDNTTSSDDDDSSNTGLLIGIIVSVVVVAIIAILVTFYCFKQKRQSHHKVFSAAAPKPDSKTKVIALDDGPGAQIHSGPNDSSALPMVNLKSGKMSEKDVNDKLAFDSNEEKSVSPLALDMSSINSKLEVGKLVGIKKSHKRQDHTSKRKSRNREPEHLPTRVETNASIVTNENTTSYRSKNNASAITNDKDPPARQTDDKHP